MNNIYELSIIFISIILEAFPFVLFGVLISALLEEFVSTEFFTKFIPKNKILGAFVGVILGFFIPACDCAVIPISRSLIKKGVPINVAITFMIASPIVNPAVLLATFYAFGSFIPGIFVARTVLGIVIAIIVGFIVAIGKTKGDVLKQINNEDVINNTKSNLNDGNRFKRVLSHIINECIDIFKYLSVGALIASFMQVFIPKDLLLSVSGNGVLSILVLMLFSYLLSLCSTSDSFIAKTFANQFTNSSILAFLLLGPILDIKNTIVLLSSYKSKFVFKLTISIFIIIFITTLITHFLGII